MFFSSEFLKSAVPALKEEIARQKALADKIESDLWPVDYDPNDVAIYKGMLYLFEKHRHFGIEISDLESKPVKMALEVINRYLEGKIDSGK